MSAVHHPIAANDPRYYSGLVMAYLKQGDAEEAERVLRAATEIDGCASESRLVLAALLERQHAPDDVGAPYRAHLAEIEAGRAIREGS